MKIILAGYNIDHSLISKLPEGGDPATPETLSAAYSRISRDPRPIDELRSDALEDVKKARKSNTNIVFGLGHSSVAEHAVFNFDLIGISRLAVEAIESHRLNSYTEKSQRYIKLNRDYIVPEEIEKAGLAEEFNSMVNLQFDAYSRLLERLLPYFREKYPHSADDKKSIARVEGLAKEDARYALPLATTSQLGMTVNARNLEYLISRLAGDPLAENRQISSALYEHAVGIAPSLIKYIEPDRIYSNDSASSMETAGGNSNTLQPPPASEFVRLLKYDPEAEAVIIAALSAESSGGFDEAMRKAIAMKKEERMEFFRNRLQGLSQWDRVPREFELADFTFELIISSSCFAQLKRHRMATLIPYKYDTSLGFTVPDSVKETGTEDILLRAVEKAEKLYRKMIKTDPSAANYALTNAHRRKVLMKMNARELYHFSRLREDEHSQWDIRRIACGMMNRVRQVMPALFILACGKDRFSGLFDSIYPATLIAASPDEKR
jgi:flavin-dependent thymidylate synthase